MKHILMKLAGMPTCEKVNSFLGMYLDNELSEKDRKSFEKHLAKCGTCTRYFEQYRATVEAVRAEGGVPVPDTLVEHTLEFLRSKADFS